MFLMSMEVGASWLANFYYRGLYVFFVFFLYSDRTLS